MRAMPYRRDARSILISIQEKDMDWHFTVYLAVGIVAQMIDGCLGMAYGVSSNSFLLSAGVPPAAASASVHTAEVFTTAISGISHWKFGNLDKDLVRRLIVPGVLGGVLGAYVLTSLPGRVIKPFISLYLLLMGARILYMAARGVGSSTTLPSKLQLGVLGLVGGVCDAMGGGGWGPIVTTTLVSRGHSPRKTIGSVNFSEFFVTFAEVITFIVTIGLVNWQVILGLALGGAAAAPFGAYLTKKIPARPMMIVVGCLIIGLSIRTIFLAIV
jgi:uncharacterized membrane protein YfcA